MGIPDNLFFKNKESRKAPNSCYLFKDGKVILLPKVRTEYGRKGFHSIGGKLFSMLPLQGRSLNRKDFLGFINNYYYELCIPVGLT